MLAYLAAFPTSLAAEAKLNLIVVLVDDLGWMDLSCQGSQFHRTPHIDELASRGMRFTNGYAACGGLLSHSRRLHDGALSRSARDNRLDSSTWQRNGKQVTFEDRPVGYQVTSKQPLLCPLNPYWMDHEQMTLAEELQAAGYVTGHIGKWHLGDDLWLPETQGFVENVGGCDYGHPPSYFDPYESEDKQGRVWRLAKIDSREKGNT